MMNIICARARTPYDTRITDNRVFAASAAKPVPDRDVYKIWQGQTPTAGGVWTSDGVTGSDQAIPFDYGCALNSSPEVLKQVLEIADMALKLDITSETREGVLKAQKEIQQILYEKHKK